LPVPGPVNQSAEYAVIDGQDTLAFELVTTCARRIISDNDSRKPFAHIHYEAELGENGIPTVLSLEIWNNGASVEGPPSQFARHFAIGDTAFTQVWKGNKQQLQRAKSSPGSFPLVSGYVGLLSQLLRVLRAAGTNASIPIFYVGTGGEKGVALVSRDLPDSIVVQIDSSEFRAAWDDVAGLEGGQASRSGFHIVRTALQPPEIATRRCDMPKLSPPKAIAVLHFAPLAGAFHQTGS
jgi:hypothetical protein